jgi:hypothetical protein
MDENPYKPPQVSSVPPESSPLRLPRTDIRRRALFTGLFAIAAAVIIVRGKWERIALICLGILVLSKAAWSWISTRKGTQGRAGAR